MTSLSVNDLRKFDEEKKNKNHQLYKELLEEVYEKIKKRNKSNYKNTTYDIPLVKIGYPLINIMSAMQYIIMKLNKGGFVAFPFGDMKKIYIDWSVNIQKQHVDKRTSNKSGNITLSDEFLDLKLNKIRKNV